MNFLPPPVFFCQSLPIVCWYGLSSSVWHCNILNSYQVHFQPRDFVAVANNGYRQLRHGAIPSVLRPVENIGILDWSIEHPLPNRRRLRDIQSKYCICSIIKP